MTLVMAISVSMERKMADPSLAPESIYPVMMAMLLKEGMIVQPAVRMESGNRLYPSVWVCGYLHMMNTQHVYIIVRYFFYLHNYLCSLIAQVHVHCSLFLVLFLFILQSLATISLPQPMALSAITPPTPCLVPR